MNTSPTLIIRDIKEDNRGGIILTTSLPRSPWSYQEVNIDIQITTTYGESLSLKSHNIIKKIILDKLGAKKEV